MIKPIYKNKGDPMNPENYRPITLVSCLGKLFTAVLNERLNMFLSEKYLKKIRRSSENAILQVIIFLSYSPFLSCLNCKRRNYTVLLLISLKLSIVSGE